LSYFEPNDEMALAGQMVRVYNSLDLRSKLVAKAKQEYAPICWEKMRNRYLDLMARISGANGLRTVAETRPIVASILGQ